MAFVSKHANWSKNVVTKSASTKNQLFWNAIKVLRNYDDELHRY